MSGRFDLIAVGDNCIDRLTGRMQADLVGGNAVNVAVQGALAGLRTAYAGAVGPVGEADGDRVIAALIANGVDVGCVERDDRPTSVTELRVDDDGDRHIVAEAFGACEGWGPCPRGMTRLEAARHVHIGWLNDGGATRRALAAAGVPVSQDVSVNALTPRDIAADGLTLAFASLSEAHADLAEARVAELVAGGATAAVVTLGRGGSLALVDGRMHRAKADPVEATDTTGAGDSYIAGFLAARLTGADITEAMAAGHARAARTCTHPGGFPQ